MEELTESLQLIDLKPGREFQAVSIGKPNLVRRPSPIESRQIHGQREKGGAGLLGTRSSGLPKPRDKAGQADPVSPGKILLGQITVFVFNKEPLPFTGCAMPPRCWLIIHPPSLTPASRVNRRTSPDGYDAPRR